MSRLLAFWLAPRSPIEDSTKENIPATGVAAGQFTVSMPLCIILPQYARGKRAENSTCWAEAGEFAGGFAGASRRAPALFSLPPVRAIPADPLRRTHRRRLRRPRRASRGQKGGSSERLPAAAHHGSVPGFSGRAGAHLRRARPGQGILRCRAYGTNRS